MSGIATVLSNSLNVINNSGFFEEKDGTDLLAALVQQQNGLENLSNQFLQTGIDQYLNKKYEEAAKSFEAAIAIAPQSSYNAETTQHLVQTYLKLEDTDKALETYEKAIDRQPSNADLHAAVAQLYYSEERYEESVQHYRSAMENDPSVTNRYSYGEALLKIGNYSEAEVQFNQVKRLDSESYAGDYGLGKMYAQSGDYESAIKHFETALELSPDFYDAYARSGMPMRMMARSKKPEQWPQSLKKKMKIWPTCLDITSMKKNRLKSSWLLPKVPSPTRCPKGIRFRSSIHTSKMPALKGA